MILTFLLLFSSFKKRRRVLTVNISLEEDIVIGNKVILTFLLLFSSFKTEDEF